jgi:hypothetical protein
MADINEEETRSAGFAVAPLPDDEAVRQKAVEALGLLDTPPEERFDAVVRLAARLFQVPIGYIALIDREHFVKGILPALSGKPENGLPPLFQHRYRTYFRKEPACFPSLPGAQNGETPC